MVGHTSYDAIVLAGRRAGEDPFAHEAGVAHRALIPVAGEPMLQRVVSVLRAHAGVERIAISIDRPELLDDVAPLRDWIASGEIVVLRAADSPSRSALEALDACGNPGAPVLLTTADHALLDDAMLAAFLAGAEASGADVCAGLVSEGVLREAYPDSQRTYLRFRAGAFSGANLFALRTAEARRAVEFWRRLEHLRKQPWRLVSTFGLVTLALYQLRLLSLPDAFERASKVIGARCAPVTLPFAEAAIDVDRPADRILVEQIIAARSGPS